MDPIQAIVQKVIADGRHGPYAVALSDDGVRRNITFSLKSDVWQESSLPEQGSYVMLSLLQKKRAGWRAMSGRFLIPTDEQSAHSKEQ